jgi:hypothetical protein
VWVYRLLAYICTLHIKNLNILVRGACDVSPRRLRAADRGYENFVELRYGEVRRMHLLRTPVNKGKRKRLRYILSTQLLPLNVRRSSASCLRWSFASCAFFSGCCFWEASFLSGEFGPLSTLSSDWLVLHVRAVVVPSRRPVQPFSHRSRSLAPGGAMIRPEGIIGSLCTSGYAFLMLYIRSLQYRSGSMQDRASGLPRIVLLGIWVNRRR